jgi:hypothetical protein
MIPDFYIINNDGTKQKIDRQKILIEYHHGAKVTIECIEHNKDTEEICIRGYYGEQEYEPSEKNIVFNIRSGGCNLITVKPELF